MVFSGGTAGAFAGGSAAFAAAESAVAAAARAIPVTAAASAGEDLAGAFGAGAGLPARDVLAFLGGTAGVAEGLAVSGLAGVVGADAGADAIGALAFFGGEIMAGAGAAAYGLAGALGEVVGAPVKGVLEFLGGVVTAGADATESGFAGGEDGAGFVSVTAAAARPGGFGVTGTETGAEGLAGAAATGSPGWAVADGSEIGPPNCGRAGESEVLAFFGVAAADAVAGPDVDRSGMAGSGRAGMVGSMRDVGGSSAAADAPERVSDGRSGAGAIGPEAFFAGGVAAVLSSGILGKGGSAGFAAPTETFVSAGAGSAGAVGGFDSVPAARAVTRLVGGFGKSVRASGRETSSGTFGSGGSPALGTLGAGATGPFASAGEAPASVFSAAKAASAAVIGWSREVPAGSGGGGSGRARGCSGGIARRVTASFCEAEGLRVPVKGGAGRRIALDWAAGTDGAGAAGVTLAGGAEGVGAGATGTAGPTADALGRSAVASGGGVAAASAGVEERAGAIEEVDFFTGSGVAATGADLTSSGRAGGPDCATGAGLISSGRGKEPVTGFTGNGGVAALPGAAAAGAAGPGPGGMKTGVDLRVSGAVAGGGSEVRRRDAVRGRTPLAGGVGVPGVGAAEPGCSAARAGGGAVTGDASTGPDLRVIGAAGVRRREAVAGRTRPVCGFGGSASVAAPNAGGRGPVSALAVTAGLGSGSVARPADDAG